MIPAQMLVPLYAAALFLGSLLLFGIQPMVTKMVLPKLGGSPAVWNTAQVFFQAALLAGYLYAHVITRFLEKRVRIAVHLALLASAMIFLPIGISPEWAPSLEKSPIPSLLGMLALSVGLPFFAVATTAPLLQSWFSQTGHSSASDPYFLYSASNLGGLFALLGYPFLFESTFGLARQGVIWAGGFVGLALLVATVGILLPRGEVSVAGTNGQKSAVNTKTPPVAWRLRIRWLLLAFAPSSLMLGVTLHITTDIAASPFLWVVPLALYLLTFVVSFARNPPLKHSWMLILQPVLVGLLIVFFDTERLALGFGLHLLTFFVTAMVCHGELARTRPHADRLTEFYIWLSLGGVLGGTFSGVVAPVLFESVVEYPIALVLACALRPGTFTGTRSDVARDFALPVLLGLAFLAVVQRIPGVGEQLLDVVHAVMVLVVCGLLYVFRTRGARFTLSVALLLGVSQADLGVGIVIAKERSFFGVHRVIVDTSGAYHVLTNGKTIHGAQYMHPTLFREPLTYYSRTGPADQVFEILRKTKPDARVGAIGLGTGAITCFLASSQSLTYFEIDPDVAALALNPKYFLFLSACGRNVKIVYGDGRRNLDTLAAESFDLLVLDAFSSDAIPAHLLTREAISSYIRRLKPGGVLLMHISNRRLDLVPVAGSVAAAAGLSARVQVHEPDDPVLRNAYHWPSTWVIAARTDSDLDDIDASGKWRRLAADSAVQPWTDDYSNVAGAIKWDEIW